MNLKNLFKKEQPNAKTNITLNKVSIDQPEPMFRHIINPNSIHFALSDAELGKLRSIQALYRQLYKFDDNLAADTDVRTEAAKTASFILPDNLGKQQADYFNEFLSNFLPDLIDHVMDLKLRGLLFRQIIYTQENGLYKVSAFEDYKNLDLRHENRKVELYINDKPVSLSNLKFVALYNDYPVYESLLKYYAFTSFALNNWASFMEIYGKPIRIGKYKPGSAQNEKDNLWNMVKNLGTDLAAMISENTAIEFVEHKSVSASSDLYHNLLKFCRESVTKRILGQVLTTTSQATGSYAQAKVHEMVRQDILAGDLRDAGLYISNICTLLNQINFNQDKISVKLMVNDKIDLEKRIDIDTKLSALVPLDPDYYYNTYNIPKPAKTNVVNNVGATLAVAPLAVAPLAVAPLAVDQLKPHNSKFNIQNSQLSTSLPDITEIHDEYIATLNSYEDIQNAPFPDKLYKEYARQLSEAILNAYMGDHPVGATLAVAPLAVDHSKFNIQNSQLFETDWSLLDIKALNAFRAEAFEVAGVTCQETLQMLKKEAEKAFTDGITFADWRNNVKLKGFSADNPYHLRTNFNTAINNAYLARQWNDLQEIKDFFPYLKYTAVMDDRVREEHAEWNGLILHVDDDFWKTNYPPNGWNCRCSVTPMPEKEAKQDPDFGKKPDPYTTTDPNFRKNSALDNSIWGKWLDKKDVGKAVKSADELNLPQWKEYTEADQPDPIPIPNNADKKTLLDIMKNYLNDRIINDPNNFPVFLDKSKSEKFERYSRDDIEKRVKYMACIDDTIQNPTEIWLDYNQKRIRYLKKYSQNILVIADFHNGQFDYFNIITEVTNTYIEKQRAGFYLGR